MSSSHRKRRGRGTPQAPADEPRRRRSSQPDQPADAAPPEPADASAAPRRGRAKPRKPISEPPSPQPATASSQPELPPIEVPVIGPPRRKPSRKPPLAPEPALPPGALVSLTISGGLAFSQRALVVYDDGRATYAQLGAGRSQSQRSFHLGDDQIAAVREELGRLDQGAFGGRVAPPAPDAYSYELAARLGDTVASATVSTGFIPPELAPLLRLLRDLVPAA